MIDKEFVPYEPSLALKELGFDEPCLGYWRNEDLPNTITIGRYTTKEDMEYEISGQDECHNFKNIIALAPTYSQCFRWFREKYVLLGFIEPANGYEDKSLFAFYICDDEQNIINDEHSYSKDSSLHFKTYEEAELECLKKLIEICKTKTNE
jgi:hypothetical protein